MIGYPRLCQLGDLGEFVDGEFLASKEPEEAKAGGVREDTEEAGHFHAMMPFALTCAGISEIFSNFWRFS